MKNILLLLSVMSYCAVSATNQIGKKYLEDKISKYNMIFTYPERYSFVASSPECLEIGDSLIFSNVTFVKSNNDNLLIGFYFQELNFLEKEKATPPSSAFTNKIVWMDTYRYNNRMLCREKPKIYSSDKNFMLNADISGEWKLKMQKPYRGKYSDCTMRFFEKSDQVLVFIFYLYQSENKEMVKKQIEDTFDILRFGDK